MARLTRQIGITAAEVRLPGPASVGPAIIKTAGGMADQAFALASDKREQEANLAAQNMNFERDGDGNLAPPSLPLGKDGMLGPSIYDRQYTKMVADRYLNQTQIDVSERLNKIASENPRDPDAFRILAEAYVMEVTKLAPGIIKADVNQVAQVKMVEHFNEIVRKTAEFDHIEAAELQLMSLDKLSSEYMGRITSGASDEEVGAVKAQLMAGILSGRDVREGGNGFWNDADMAEMIEAIDKQYVMGTFIRSITNLPETGTAYADAEQAFEQFSEGEGTLKLVDELGSSYKTTVMEMFPNPAERAEIASHLKQILDIKQAAFTGVKDERLKRDFRNFMNWYSPEWIKTKGNVDVGELHKRYDQAHADVMDLGYEDDLRETIRGLLSDAYTSGGNASQFIKDFDLGFKNWMNRFDAKYASLLNGRDPESLSPEEIRKLESRAYSEIGNVPGGNNQSAQGAREIYKYYNPMTGREMTREYFDEAIQNPNGRTMQELAYMVPARMARIGIWPVELTDAIIGRLRATEGMDADTLNGTLKLARIFWDNPTFRANMQDSNALGETVGGALELLFSRNGRLDADNVRSVLDDFSAPNYDPYINYDQRNDEEKAGFDAIAQKYIEDQFKNNYFIFGGPEGLEVPRLLDDEGGGLNPFSPQFAGLDGIYLKAIAERTRGYAGKIDPNNLATFAPWVRKAAKSVMDDYGLAPTKIGHDPARFSRYYNGSGWPPTGWPRGFMSFFNMSTRPAYSITSRPPEYFIAGDLDLTKMGDIPAGKVNRMFLEDYVIKDVQTILNEHSKNRWPNKPPQWQLGVNAGLQYSGIESSQDRNGVPSWKIILTAANYMDTEVLTLEDDYRGNHFIYDYQAAKKRYIKDVEEALKNGVDLHAQFRTKYQQETLKELEFAN